MDHARYSTIAHRDLAYCNPIDPATLEEAIDQLGLGTGSRVLDVGCGKGALLVRLAERFGARCTGVDINAGFLAEGRAHAERQGVAASIELIEMEAASVALAPSSFDAGICIGASHALGGYAATLRELTRLVGSSGSILVGEGFWRRDPDPEYLDRLGATADELTTHDGNLAMAAQQGLEPRGAWVSSDRDWDRYEEAYARGIETYVATHPEDPDAAAMGERIRRWRETYLRWGRDTLGFALYLFARPRPERGVLRPD
jgi:cyclopropane fatty-acyl-phospholipid synthase-like methyltransferase